MVLGPKEGYDLYAEEYKKDHPHLDSFDWETCGLWIRESLLGMEKPVRVVVDLGCGDGRVLGRLQRWRKNLKLPAIDLIGCDMSPAMMARAAKRSPEALFLTGDLTDPQFWPRLKNAAGSEVDLVLSFFVLVHLPRPEDFFREVKTILHPGGSFIFNTIPQRHPPVLSAGGRKFTIEAQNWDPDKIQSCALAEGFSLFRRDDLREKGDLVSTVFWLKKL